MWPDLGRRRNLFYVGDDLRGQLSGLRPMKEFQTIYEQSRLLAQRNGWTPFPPAVIRAACIERRPKNADRNASLHLIPKYNC
jgi:hypothetical protein